jgi:hypothetical protein
MEISMLNGSFRDYRYEAMWWRSDGELHWRAEVFQADRLCAAPRGSIQPGNRGNEEANVRASVETFIETSEQALAAQRDPSGMA